MTNYILSKDAQVDLREVARHTKRKWGKEQLTIYRKGLKATFNAIGNNDVVPKKFSARHPRVCVTKYRYHYIFYIAENVEKPIVIAVMHERRDIVSRLSERLS